MINNNFPFLLKYVLLVSSLPEGKTRRSKCDAIPFHKNLNFSRKSWKFIYFTHDHTLHLFAVYS